MIKTLLYTIIYPLAIELFASRKNRGVATNGMNLNVVWNGPPEIDLGVAKKFSITIMRLPYWKRLIALSERWKSDLIFDCVCRLLALMNFCWPRWPATRYLIRLCEPPLQQNEEALAIRGDFPFAIGILRQQSTQRCLRSGEQYSTPEYRTRVFRKILLS